MICDAQDRAPVDPSSYSARLREHFRSVLPTPPRRTSKPTYIHKDLSTSPFVFVRVDTVKKPLQPPYDGPYKVLQRKSKYFILDRTKDSVSIDRLKPAYLESPPKSALTVRTHRPNPTTQTAKFPISPPSPTSPQSFSGDTLNPLVPPPLTPELYYTHSGRRVAFPSRLTDYVHLLSFERFLPPLSYLKTL
nr:gag pol polyprotein [Hymenolepis microstoma]